MFAVLSFLSRLSENTFECMLTYVVANGQNLVASSVRTTLLPRYVVNTKGNGSEFQVSSAVHVIENAGKAYCSYYSFLSSGRFPEGTSCLQQKQLQ